MQIKEKKVMVAGMGKSGISVIDTLLHLGAEIYPYDGKAESEINEIARSIVKEHHLKAFFGKEPSDLSFLDMLVLSPGIPLNIPLVKKAKEQNIEILGELELAYRLSEGTYIAITGTNGKTTTTALVGEIFNNAGKETHVVGNIGVPVISKATSTNKESYMITEVSSFQLETVKEFKPQISAVLNITQDHLNRHETMKNYENTKARIYENQTKENYFIVNYDDEAAYKLHKNCKATVVPFSRKTGLDFGCYVENQCIVVKNKKCEIIKICPIDEMALPGLHNLENALAATAIAYFSGIASWIIKKVLKEFRGVEHRIEYVDTVRGVQFINDSKATNPDSSIKAVETMKTDTILIAGGMDKGSDFSEFINAFNGKIKALVLLGETATKMKRTAQENGFNQVIIKSDLEECVLQAFEIASSGDTVLLSPACASWDMYPSYEKRGEHFKKCVSRLRRTVNVK